MTDTDTAPAAAGEQPHDLDHFLADQVRRVFDSELERVSVENTGTDQHPHWYASCDADSWFAYGPNKDDLDIAVRTHVSKDHPAGQIATGMFALLRRYHAAHAAAERGVGTPLATAQNLALRALHRALRSVAVGFDQQPGYNLAWTPRD